MNLSVSNPSSTLIDAARRRLPPVIRASVHYYNSEAEIDRLIAALGAAGRRVEILVHACSIGAEVWSLAMHLAEAWPDFDFHIDATDISAGFVQFAQNGLYPRQIVDHLAPAEQACFDLLPDGRASVKAAIRGRVDFLAPASFVEFEPGGRYDVVSL
ncbi:MAG: CheR family methyltransferase, partial [Alphaproteobacteria bacterium]